eukprot:scaffold1813_cov129-Isochrysis_galbana.AAC.11
MGQTRTRQNKSTKITPPPSRMTSGGTKPTGRRNGGAFNLEGGTLFQYFYAVVRTRGNNRVKVAGFLTPLYSRNMYQLFE